MHRRFLSTVCIYEMILLPQGRAELYCKRLACFHKHDQLCPRHITQGHGICTRRRWLNTPLQWSVLAVLLRLPCGAVIALILGKLRLGARALWRVSCFHCTNRQGRVPSVQSKTTALTHPSVQMAQSPVNSEPTPLFMRQIRCTAFSRRPEWITICCHCRPT